MIGSGSAERSRGRTSNISLETVQSSDGRIGKISFPTVFLRL